MSSFRKSLKSFRLNNTKVDTKTVFYRLGGSGTKTTNGYIYEEYNEKIKDKKTRQDIFLQMDNDSTVFELRNAINLAKLSTNFFVDPYKDENGNSDTRDQQIAEFVSDCLFNHLNQGRRQFMEEITLYVRDGFSLFELYFEKNEKGYIPQMCRMTCDTVHKWKQSNGDAGIQQMLYYPKDSENEENNLNDGKGTIDIPSNKLLLFNINAEGQNYEGQSLYRKILKDRFIKDKLENYHATFQERFAIPSVKLKVPVGTTAQDLAKYGEVAENLRSHEDGYVISYVDENGAVVDYDFMQTSMSNDTKLLEGIKHYQQNIVDVFFAQFLYLGKSEKGSYGMASTSMNFYFQGIKAMLEKDMEIINKYLIPKIVLMNFSEVGRYPKLNFGQLGFIDTKVFSETLVALTGSSLLSKNYETEKYIRELLHLPELSEEERGEMREHEAMAKKEAEEKQIANKVETEEEIEKKKEIKASCGCDDCKFDDSLAQCFSHDLIIQAQVKDEISCKKSYKRDFADPIIDDYRRPLTFAERKVNIQSIKSNTQKEEEKLEKQYSEVVGKMTSDLLGQVDTIVKNNKTKDIANISAKGNIGEIVSLAYKTMFDIGKNEASREIGVEIPKTKKEVSQLISVQSENMASQLSQKAETEVKNILTEQISRNGGISTTSNVEMVSTIKKNLSDMFDKALQTVSTIAITQSLNAGRKSVADINADMIHGAQYSAIIDGRTSNRCLSLDGRVVRVGSDDYVNYTPPQHTRCRSIWVYINDDEEYKPEIESVPNSIPVKDTLNSKEELKAPVVMPGSPAIKQIQDEIDFRKSKLESQTGKVQEKNQEIINRLEKSLDNVM